jgi:hypothetical protein
MKLGEDVHLSVQKDWTDYGYWPGIFLYGRLKTTKRLATTNTLMDGRRTGYLRPSGPKGNVLIFTFIQHQHHLRRPSPQR